MLLQLRLKYRRVHAMQRDMAEVMSLEFVMTFHDPFFFQMD